MGRKKTVKNPKITDEQRQKVLTRRVREERASADDIWDHSKPKTLTDRVADYIESKTIGNHITSRILRGVAYGLKYGESIYPKTPEEKWFDRTGLQTLGRLVRRIRTNEDYNWLSFATEVLHENPDTGDLEYVCYDFRAEQEAQGKRRITREHPELTNWKANRQQIEDTKAQITDETVARATLTTEEYQKRREGYRRKRNNREGESEN